MPYLSVTNEHTQEGPTRKYVVTLAFAHTGMPVRTHMYVHSRTPFAHSHSCAHTHSLCAQPCICTCTLMCEHKFMHMRRQPHTRAGIYAQAITCYRTHTHAVIHGCMHIHTRTFATHTRAHSVIHSHSWMHTCARLLVNTHSCTPTFARPLIHAHSCMHTCPHTHARAHASTSIPPTYTNTRPG